MSVREIFKKSFVAYCDKFGVYFPLAIVHGILSIYCSMLASTHADVGIYNIIKNILIGKAASPNSAAYLLNAMQFVLLFVIIPIVEIAFFVITLDYFKGEKTSIYKLKPSNIKYAPILFCYLLLNLLANASTILCECRNVIAAIVIFLNFIIVFTPLVILSPFVTISIIKYRNGILKAISRSFAICCKHLWRKSWVMIKLWMLIMIVIFAILFVLVFITKTPNEQISKVFSMTLALIFNALYPAYINAVLHLYNGFEEMNE